jgi:TRAP-type uncharacterized transport system fused permease subunit
MMIDEKFSFVLLFSLLAYVSVCYVFHVEVIGATMSGLFLQQSEWMSLKAGWPMLRSFNLLCIVLVLFMRLLTAYGSACFDDWACLLLLCCNEFLLVILSKLGLLLRAALYSFPMGSVSLCFRFLSLGF